MSPLPPPWDVYLPLGLVLGGILALAWLGGPPSVKDPAPAPDLARIRLLSIGRPVGWRLEYVGGPADGWILTLPERPGTSDLLGGRYEPEEPAPDGRVRMRFVGFVAMGRGVVS